MMYEVQIKIKVTSMNAYAGWLTVHQTTVETNARKTARSVDSGSYLNLVSDVRVLRDGHEVNL